MYAARLMTMVAILLAAFQGSAWPEPKSYPVACLDPNETCTTVFYGETIQVGCSYVIPPPKGQPLASVGTLTYRCDSEVKGDKRVLVCRGFIGVLPNIKATLTEAEFLDDQTRCDKICWPCPKGWK